MHSEESLFFKQTSVAIVIVFWLKWAGYLAVAGLNLLAQISERISLGQQQKVGFWPSYR